MKTAGILLLAGALCLLAQSDAVPPEETQLQQALAEAGSSPIEIIRAIENHLQRYPNSHRKAELERALAKTAMDSNDDARTILYGERVLASDPDNLQLLEHVAAALLRTGEKSGAERGLRYARRFEELIQATYKNDKFGPGSGAAQARRKDEFDHAMASTKLFEARALGTLGQTQAAIQLAQSSYEIFPSVEGAREAGRWLSAAGKDKDAIGYYAIAFTISGMRATDTPGSADRDRLGELYRKVNGSEAGLGDVILKAYDTTAAVFAARRNLMREYDPNVQVKDPMQFTLSGLNGDKLKLASLQGKVVVMDFWATWCIPCRAQHPLYDAVKARFKESDDVVFLSIDADQDKTVVKPFLEAQKWSLNTYFEDGLQALFQVSSIPTTIILGRKGDVTSRLVGFIPDRFVDMLTDRIDEALGKPHATPPKPMTGTIGPTSKQ